jgi:hypothetical protein
MKNFVFLLAFVALACADLYLHNPRGSNNREREDNTNRNNANRLFDSQNNGKGGYCWGPSMTYYEGSQLSVEWTNQHGCGRNVKLYCNLVIQYMCSKTTAPNAERLRDGYTTDRIPEGDQTPPGYDVTDPNDPSTTKRLLYGMHEPWENYLACKSRDRNMGLWISDREKEGGLSPGRRSAIFTRQNNNGNRHGYECTEERDYYPYWHPSPWRDIAILTHDTSLCSWYQEESQNVKSRGWCYQAPTAQNQQNKYARWNNEKLCKINGATWKTQEPWGIRKPECVIAPFTRHNHLGNTLDGFASSFNWTLPTSGEEACIEAGNCECVLRIRYNISTHDMGGENAHNPKTGFLDWTSNALNSPVKQDPTKKQDGLPLTLAIDTSQFGRTFQDRSHMFHIKKRPSGVSDVTRIHNLNVRGKRGNIVQTYPATEYDYVPQYLKVRVGDMIHFQWTGCDNNPAGNAGEGTAKTDRSNIVQLKHGGESHPATDEELKSMNVLFEDQGLRKRMNYIDQTGCKTIEELKADQAKDGTNINQNKANCMVLNAAKQYFDGGLVKMNSSGEYWYMSSRNNNFTNRGQKGYIKVADLLPTWAVIVVIAGGVLFLASSALAGVVFYAKRHPEWSTGRNILDKF